MTVPVIRDSIFINNNNPIYVYYGYNITAINCWFGNNATNYNDKPEVENTTMDNWLFLNATVNPTNITIGQNSIIKFELKSYNKTSEKISPYDASKMNVIIELSQTLGELNQTTALIAENVIYTAKQEGTGSVTGKVETSFYTVNLKNNGTAPIPTNITVNTTSLNLTANETGTIGATLNPPEAGNLTFTSNDTNIATVDVNGVVIAVAKGTAIITVSFAGNEHYAPAENKTITVTVSDKPSPKNDLNISAFPFTIGENVTVIVTGFENATGNVTVTVGDNNFTSSIMRGMAFVFIPKSDKNITAYIYYPGDDNYNNASTTVDILVKKNLNLTAIADPITVGENATIIVTGFENATGNVMVIIGRGFYNVSIINSTATVVTSGLNNTTTAYVIYLGDDDYNMAFTSVNITVNPNPDKKNLTLNATARPITVGENVTIIVTGFENATGDVTARIGGSTLSTPIVDGTATFIVPDITSSTIADIIYDGDDEYNAASTTVNITVYPKSDVVIVAENVTKYYHGPERFVANIYDSELNPMVNKSVNITINGVTYTRTTDANGTVSLAINLGSGTYNVITQVDNTTLKSSITVLSTVIGSDITKYYRNATQYSVQVYDTNGKVVGAGEVVTFNINGIFYNHTTDENGIATLNINLPPSEYIITADYKGCKISNNIKVLPVLNATDITMKYLDGTQFKVNLVDGQGNPYKNQFVTFNVNGILYNRLTDSNGQAALNIRLPSGEYIITSSFNGANIANKITITR